MEPLEIFFNIFVVAAFFAASVDHWFVGRGYIVVPLRAFMLGCFVFTETYLAVTAQWAMWFYVSLNVWGLANLYLGRRSVLRTRCTGCTSRLENEQGGKDVTSKRSTKSGHGDYTSP